MAVTRVTAAEVSSRLEGTDVKFEIESDSLVYVIPRFRMSESLRILKEAGLVPASAPLMYV